MIVMRGLYTPVCNHNVGHLLYTKIDYIGIFVYVSRIASFVKYMMVTTRVYAQNALYYGRNRLM